MKVFGWYDGMNEPYRFFMAIVLATPGFVGIWSGNSLGYALGVGYWIFLISLRLFF